MRQAVRAFIISGVLLSAGACGTATNPAPGEPGVGIGSAAATSGTAQAADGSLKSSCEALGQVYSKQMAPLAEALTRLANKGGGKDKESQRQVQQSLTSFASAIRDATQNSTDARLKADGKQTADQLQAKAADAGAFGKLTSAKDVNAALGTTLKGWLSPVEQHCS